MHCYLPLIQELLSNHDRPTVMDRDIWHVCQHFPPAFTQRAAETALNTISVEKGRENPSIGLHDTCNPLGFPTGSIDLLGGTPFQRRRPCLYWCDAFVILHVLGDLLCFSPGTRPRHDVSSLFRENFSTGRRQQQLVRRHALECSRPCFCFRAPVSCFPPENDTMTRRLGVLRAKLTVGTRYRLAAGAAVSLPQCNQFLPAARLVSAARHR